MTEERDQTYVLDDAGEPLSRLALDDVAVRIWSRTIDGWCSCPYCTATRDARQTRISEPSEWRRRMGSLR